MRIWFDTEFMEDGRTIELLSIGMVREDGQRLYLENSEADWRRANAWVKENVLLKLVGRPPASMPRSEIARRVRDFAGESPELWAYFSAYDWVVLCQLFGTMMDLPKGWPMYCRDFKQVVDEHNWQCAENLAAHNALSDAIWLRDEYVRFLDSR